MVELSQANKANYRRKAAPDSVSSSKTSWGEATGSEISMKMKKDVWDWSKAANKKIQAMIFIPLVVYIPYLRLAVPGCLFRFYSNSAALLI